jgi:hypothetical protein
METFFKTGGLLIANTSNIEGDHIKLLAWPSRAMENTNSMATQFFWTIIAKSSVTGDVDDLMTTNQHEQLTRASNCNFKATSVLLKNKNSFRAKTKRHLENTKLWSCEVRTNGPFHTSRSSIDKIKLHRDGFSVILSQDICENSATSGSIANILLKRIKQLDDSGKKQLALKETHKTIDNLLFASSFDLVDALLSQSSKTSFSLSVFVALLASTKRFKEDLKNRDALFETAHQLAVAEIGRENLNKSVFALLK